jgi:tRNA pseudouridine55 synthase
MQDGILVMNKPQGMTSHDVVQLARARLGIRRLGHAGTLDPIAQGVLVLLVGRATKHQKTVQTYRKAYEATMQLGTQTDTGDAWGKPLRTAPVPSFARTNVDAVLAALVGSVTQVPPAFSAVKVRGRPLYWWARRGTPLEAKPRTIEVFSAELIELQSASVRCRIVCSSGTYIRSLAEAIADRLGTVGHVSALTRLSVGPWTLAQALDLCWLATAPAEEVWAAVQPLEAIGHACR